MSRRQSGMSLITAIIGIGIAGLLAALAVKGLQDTVFLNSIIKSRSATLDMSANIANGVFKYTSEIIEELGRGTCRMANMHDVVQKVYGYECNESIPKSNCKFSTDREEIQLFSATMMIDIPKEASFNNYPKLPRPASRGELIKAGISEDVLNRCSSPTLAVGATLTDPLDEATLNELKLRETLQRKHIEYGAIVAKLKAKEQEIKSKGVTYYTGGKVGSTQNEAITTDPFTVMERMLNILRSNSSLAGVHDALQNIHNWVASSPPSAQIAQQSDSFYDGIIDAIQESNLHNNYKQSVKAAINDIKSYMVPKIKEREILKAKLSSLSSISLDLDNSNMAEREKLQNQINTINSYISHHNSGSTGGRVVERIGSVLLEIRSQEGLATNQDNYSNQMSRFREHANKALAIFDRIVNVKQFPNTVLSDTKCSSSNSTYSILSDNIYKTEGNYTALANALVTGVSSPTTYSDLSNAFTHALKAFSHENGTIKSGISDDIITFINHFILSNMGTLDQEVKKNTSVPETYLDLIVQLKKLMSSNYSNPYREESIEYLTRYVLRYDMQSSFERAQCSISEGRNDTDVGGDLPTLCNSHMLYACWIIEPEEMAKKSKIFENTKYAVLETSFILLNLDELNPSNKNEPRSIPFSAYRDDVTKNRQVQMFYTLHWTNKAGNNSRAYRDSGTLRSYTSNPIN